MRELSCRAEGGKASIELSLHRPAVVEAGYGRLLFRDLGRRCQAGLKHLSIDSKQAAGAGHITTQVPLRGAVGIVKNFYGIVCAPTVKVNVPKWLDVWLMVLASGRGAFDKPVQTYLSHGESTCSGLPVGRRELSPLQPHRVRLGLQKGGLGLPLGRSFPGPSPRRWLECLSRTSVTLRDCQLKVGLWSMFILCFWWLSAGSLLGGGFLRPERYSRGMVWGGGGL